MLRIFEIQLHFSHCPERTGKRLKRETFYCLFFIICPIGSWPQSCCSDWNITPLSSAPLALETMRSQLDKSDEFAWMINKSLAGGCARGRGWRGGDFVGGGGIGGLGIKSRKEKRARTPTNAHNDDVLRPTLIVGRPINHVILWAVVKTNTPAIFFLTASERRDNKIN